MPPDITRPRRRAELPAARAERAQRVERESPGSEQFPRPPVEFVDDEGRTIAVRADGASFDALQEMYAGFTQGDRAQGIPPRSEDRLRTWLEGLLTDGVHVVAWHDDRAVGHAALLPMADDRFELVTMVHPAYQHAHVGTTTVRTLFGSGQDRGVERVWLTVQRHNNAAVNLYRSLGFRILSEGGDCKMERRL